MKKIIEMLVKTNMDIDFNSDEFAIIKEQIDKNVRKALKDEYDDFSYQCNCIKVKNEETGEPAIAVKVYLISKEMQENNEECNFILNAPETKVTTKTEEKTDEVVKKMENEISELQEHVMFLKTKIDEELGLELTEQRKKTLTRMTNELKQTETALENKIKQLNYYKSEFLI